MRKTIFAKKIFLIITSIVVILIVFVLGRPFIGKIITRTNDGSKDKATLVKNEPAIEARCTRNVRLENEPRFDRALSLVYEKVRQGEEHRSVWTSYNYFPAQLVNCIKVDAKNVKAEIEAEGYFDINNKDIKPDYFPITIDAVTYEYSDDLTTALLLVHEITHVQQYINYSSIDPEYKYKSLFDPKNKATCFNNEVAAFYAQLLFFNQLNDEEKKSLNLRIQNDKELHPQLKMLQTLQKSLNAQIIDDCDVYNYQCIMRKINWKIQMVLEESGSYDEQCGLN